MEAMAEGMPIVATPAGAIAEYVEDGKSGLLIEIESASSLANRLSNLQTALRWRKPSVRQQENGH